ncbi:aminoacyltransferase [Paratractidigestivibacter sp.]|uniref:aminoacyltransferase n=1 Tax=Paratractidigestivibacter sp. TaxID=2847316 RepID=UPI002ABD67B0|nr:aminoacyltransferase [Paratractidigestivibacter sp.]
MRSFTCIDISPKELDAFSAQSPWGNFQQSSGMGRVREKNGIEVSCLGFYEGDTLVAATQLELHRGRLSTFAEVHNGPLVDLADTELAEFVFAELKARAKAAGAAQLEITPDNVYRYRASDGAPVAAGERAAGVPAWARAGADDAGVEELKHIGFEHDGFVLGYQAVPRWRYVKDLTGIADEKALLATYAKNTKRNVRIAQDNGVRVERIGREDLPTFHAICQLSCEKQGFENRPLSYFESLYDGLGDAAEFTIAYFDTQAHLKSWEDKRDAFQADIEHLEKSLETARTPEKVERKLNDIRKKHEASLKRIETARAYIEEGGDLIPAAAALFVWHPRECVYLFSGSDPKYAKFYASTAIQHRMMLECLERGVEQYNFYGIDGVFDDPSDPGRGLLEFKQGFGGYVLEMMGSFTLPVKPLTYKAKQLAHKVLGR